MLPKKIGFWNFPLILHSEPFKNKGRTLIKKSSPVVPSFSYMLYYLVVVSIHLYPLNFAPADGHTRLGRSHPPFVWNLHGHTMYADIPWLTWFVTFHWAYAGAMHIDFHFLSLGECKILLQVGSKVFPWMTQNADAMRSMQVCAPLIDDCLIFFIGKK